MADRTISVSLRANTGPFAAQMAAAGRSAEMFGTRVNSMSSEAQALTRQAGLGFVAFGVAVAAGFGAAVFAAAKFETEMRNVATISETTRRNFQGVSDQVVEMSTRFPQSAQTLAAALYDIVSSGFDGADAMMVLEASASAASAGMTDAATAARVITAALNAYGLNASEAKNVSDILFATVDKGVITFEELAQNLGDVLGSAAALKIPLKDVGAALATITLSGIPAAEASTALNRAMKEFIDPSDEMATALRELGYESGVEAIETDGLQKVMGRLAEQTGGNIVALQGMFPEVRGMKAALALLANEGENYNRVSKGMKEATGGNGATARALEQQQKGLAFQLNLTKNQVMALVIQLGTGLLPALKGVNALISPLINGFNELPGPVKLLVAGLGGLTGLLALLAGGFLLLAPKILAAREAFHTFGNAFPVFTIRAQSAATALGVLGIAALAAVAILGVHSSETSIAEAAQRDYAAALRDSAGAINENVRASVSQRLADKDRFDLAKKLGIAERELVDIVTSKNGASRLEQAALREVNRLLDAGEEKYRSINEVRESGGESVPRLTDQERRSALDLVDTYDRLLGETEGFADAKRKQGEAHKGARDEMSKEAKEALDLGVDLQGLEDGTVELTASQKRLADAFEDLPGGLDVYNRLLQETQERQRELGEFSGLSGDALNFFVAGATVSLNEFSGALEAQNADVAQWQQDLVTAAGRVDSQVIGYLTSMGFEGRALVHQFATGSAEDVARAAEAIRVSMSQGMLTMVAELDVAMQIAQVVAKLGAAATVDRIAEEIGATPERVRFLMAAYGLEVQEGVNTVVTGLGGAAIAVIDKVSPFAYGGIEDHSPQIAKGGWPVRVWAEPETDKESYIPWAKDRRHQATQVLAATAAGFGYALTPHLDKMTAFRQGGILAPVAGLMGKYPQVPAPTYEAQGSRFGIPTNFAEGSAAGMNVMYRKGLEHAEAVAKFMEAARAQAAAAAGGFTGRGGSAQVEAWIREALTILGAPMEWLGPVAAKAMQESGGNPRAINLWDSNAAKGIPSKGLLQTIDPTFNAYKLPGYGDIWNPVHNAIAAIRYMVSRYGSPFNLPAGGYAMGGIFDPHIAGSLDQGGFLRPGWNLAFNGTGSPEPVGAPTPLAGAGASYLFDFRGAVIYGDRKAFESMVVGVVDKRDGKTRMKVRAARGGGI